MGRLRAGPYTPRHTRDLLLVRRALLARVVGVRRATVIVARALLRAVRVLLLALRGRLRIAARLGGGVVRERAQRNREQRRDREGRDPLHDVLLLHFDRRKGVCNRRVSNAE